MGDAHQVIIDHHRQVIGREAVSLQNHLVIGQRRVHLTADQVGETELDIIRDQHPHHRGLTEPWQRGSLFTGLAVTEPVIAGHRHLGRLLLGSQLAEALGGTPAVVGVPGLDQPVDEGTVGLQPLGTAGTGQMGRRCRDPRPSPGPANAACRRSVARKWQRYRARSVSSIRSRNWPPVALA